MITLTDATVAAEQWLADPNAAFDVDPCGEASSVETGGQAAGKSVV